MEKISKIKKIKLTYKINKEAVKMFKSLCMPCQKLAIINKQRPLQEYCDSCQLIMKSHLEHMERLFKDVI